MEGLKQILLGKKRNKKSVNENNSLIIGLSGDKQMLPEDSISASIDAYKLYLSEREKCNKFRIIVNINSFCSNVLFNPFTEIVRNEGSDNVTFLNVLGNYDTLTSTLGLQNSVIGKKTQFSWLQREAIRDTQLSNDKCGFDYHCGADIFNNHLVRSRTFKAVNFVNGADTSHVGNNFNTIDDYMRDRYGKVISEFFPALYSKNTFSSIYSNVELNLHLYQSYDIDTFKDAFSSKLKEQNGWYGFKNPSTMSSIGVTGSSTTTYSEISINKAINNRKYGEFIYMYPGRELYSFTPLYNRHRNRSEMNWNYCLTYPESAVITQGGGGLTLSNLSIKTCGTNNSSNVGIRSGFDFPFFEIDDDNRAHLKALMIDEYTESDNGVALLTVYSISQHGLHEGDSVNIYKKYYDDEGNKVVETPYLGASVFNVVDKYIFQVMKSPNNISDAWVIDESGRSMRLEDGVQYPICDSGRCNIDPTAQNIYFSKTENGIECDYYVRKFARIPNFKFKDCEINDKTLYDGDSFTTDSPIIRFSNPQNKYSEFESHVGKLGFAETAYGDDTTEVVFTDDVDVSYLKDNLGRPVSEIYFSVFKNNAGYKDWYGIKDPFSSNGSVAAHNKVINVNSENVEFSHCFGKVNSGFLLSDNYRRIYNHEDVRDITSENENGLIMDSTRTGDGDEIFFNHEREFYGDMCEYSHVNCEETVIQKVMNRFNTAQRELSSYDSLAYEQSGFNNGTMLIDEIEDDEGTLLYERTRSGKGSIDSLFANGELKHSNTIPYTNMLNFKEGYYHQAHFKIPIKTVSADLSQSDAEKHEIARTVVGGNGTFIMTTFDELWYGINDRITLFKKSTNEYFHVVVNEVHSARKIKCSIYNANGTQTVNIEGLTDSESSGDFFILKPNEETPEYAKLLHDGSCKYVWREIVSNGSEGEEDVYPFTNNAIYITKRINFFLRRQDPNKENLGSSTFIGGLDITPKGEKKLSYVGLTIDDEITEEDSCKPQWKSLLKV